MCLPGFFLCWASLFCCLTGIAVFETAAMESAHRRDCADTGGSSSDVVLINVEKSPCIKSSGTSSQGAIIRERDLVIVNKEVPSSELATDVVVVEDSPIKDVA